MNFSRRIRIGLDSLGHQTLQAILIQLLIVPLLLGSHFTTGCFELREKLLIALGGFDLASRHLIVDLHTDMHKRPHSNGTMMLRSIGTELLCGQVTSVFLQRENGSCFDQWLMNVVHVGCYVLEKWDTSIIEYGRICLYEGVCTSKATRYTAVDHVALAIPSHWNFDRMFVWRQRITVVNAALRSTLQFLLLQRYCECSPLPSLQPFAWISGSHERRRFMQVFNLFSSLAFVSFLR